VVTLVTNHSNIEFAIIGAVILAGVVTDELVKRYAIRRRAARELAQ
jgi:ribose transport system permease protein